MNSFKVKTIKIGFSILMGMTMASVSFVSANDAASTETSEQRLNHMAAEQSDRVARVNDLANTWSAHTRESEKTCFRHFMHYQIHNYQLLKQQTIMKACVQSLLDKALLPPLKAHRLNLAISPKT